MSQHQNNISKEKENNISKEKEKNVPKEKEQNDDETVFLDLIQKYDNLIEHLDYKNPLFYGGLFKQLYVDFKTEQEDGKIDKSIDDLAKLINKACVKLNFDIQNASIQQIIKLFNILIEKLGGSVSLRNYDADILENLLYIMYSDEELLEILLDLEEKKINPENIIGINSKNQIIFSNKKTYQLEPSSKNNQLVNYYAELNKSILKK